MHMHTLNAQNFLLRSLSLVVFFNFFFCFHEVKCSQVLSVVLGYLHMHQTPCAWDCRAYVLVWRKGEALCVERVAAFHICSPPSHLFSTVYQCEGCLLCLGCGAHGWVFRFASHWYSLHLGASCQ